MAKKPKTAAKKIVRQLTPEKDLVALLRACKGHERNIQEYVGSLREKIGYCVEKKHLHKKAFGWCRQLDKMESEDVAALLDHFHHYLDVSGIQKRADDAPGLELEPEKGEEEPATDDGKVSRPKFGGEAAGADVG